METARIELDVSIVLVNHVFGAPLPTAAQLGTWPEAPLTFVAMLVLGRPGRGSRVDRIRRP